MLRRPHTTYAISGALAGYFICHPVVMIIGRQMTGSGAGTVRSFLEIAAAEIVMSFSLDMLPWSIPFGVAGALIGLFYGKMVHVQKKLRCLSYIDALTGIPNRRYFEESLIHEWRHGIRMNKPLALLMCDIDFFKSFNDFYGHQAGDESLKTVARALSETIDRPRDLVARYGGEEFAVLLPETDSQGACRVAEAVRENVTLLGLPHMGADSRCKILTISIGAATITDGGATVTELISRADKALYLAKKSGRNTIKTFNDVNHIEFKNKSEEPPAMEIKRNQN